MLVQFRCMLPKNGLSSRVLSLIHQGDITKPQTVPMALSVTDTCHWICTATYLTYINTKSVFWNAIAYQISILDLPELQSNITLPFLPYSTNKILFLLNYATCHESTRGWLLNIGMQVVSLTPRPLYPKGYPQQSWHSGAENVTYIYFTFRTSKIQWTWNWSQDTNKRNSYQNQTIPTSSSP
jgi:hypothetical protein